MNDEIERALAEIELAINEHVIQPLEDGKIVDIRDGKVYDVEELQ
jgi:hypothetical protein